MYVRTSCSTCITLRIKERTEYTHLLYHGECRFHIRREGPNMLLGSGLQEVQQGLHAPIFFRRYEEDLFKSSVPVESPKHFTVRDFASSITLSVDLLVSGPTAAGTCQFYSDRAQLVASCLIPFPHLPLHSVSNQDSGARDTQYLTRPRQT